jgi:hypothetical protein
MGINEVEEALRLVAQRPDESFFAGARDEGLVVAAEQALGVSFPPSYRRFLRELGAGSVGASEIYGVIHSNFTESGVPDGIWITLRGRLDWALPQSMVVVYNDGMGGYFVLDTEKVGGDAECPIFVWEPGRSARGDKLELVAPDFGSFFLHRVKEALDVH